VIVGVAGAPVETWKMYCALPFFASAITCLEMSTSTCLPAFGYLSLKPPFPFASVRKIDGVALVVRDIPLTLRYASTASPTWKL